VLVKRAVLDRIVSGEIDTVFRRQKRRTVKEGSTLTTAVGVLDIVSVVEVDAGDITDDDARRAGFESAGAVRSELARRPPAVDIRVRVRFAGEDPRLALRADHRLDSDSLRELIVRLDRMDARSTSGPWTRQVLELIGGNPHVRAPDLAASIDVETAPFKANVRKLKTLGLTISHSPGYELSPRGRVLLDHLRRQA